MERITSDKFKNYLNKHFNLNNILSMIKFNNIKIQKVTAAELYRCYEQVYLINCDVMISKLQFTWKILCTVNNTLQKINEIKVTMVDPEIHKEIASCINFLQRKKDIALFFKVFIKIAELFEHRLLIFNNLRQASHMRVNITHDEELGGYNIVCFHPSCDYKYFSSTWRICWNLYNYDVFDLIDFTYNCTDKTFGNAIEPVLTNLTAPHLSLESKIKLWCSVIEVVKLVVIVDYCLSELIYRPVVVRNVNNEVLEINDESDDDVCEIDDCIIDTEPVIDISDCDIIDITAESASNVIVLD